MGLFSTLAKSGALIAKPKAAIKKTDPKVSFVTTATEKIAMIDSGDKADKGKWFKKNDDGSYTIWPRGGIATLKFNDKPVQLNADDKKSAIALLKKLIEACKDGEFDDQFEEIAAARVKNAGKPRKASTKSKTNGAAAHA